MLLIGLVFVSARAAGLVWPEACDAYSYWKIDLGALYGPHAEARPGAYGFFPYSPVLGQLTSPLGLLPWSPFLGVWTALIGLCLVPLVGWLVLPLAYFWNPLRVELMVGNINLPIALAIVVGFRYPAAWSILLLSKITPGVAIVWFAVRGEWRSFGIALGTTAALAGTSFLIAPGLWRDRLTVPSASAAAPLPDLARLGYPPLVGLPFAVLVIAIAARTDQRWPVPVGVVLALPVVWEATLTILLAMVPLLGETVRTRLGVPRWLPGRRADAAGIA